MRGKARAAYHKGKCAEKHIPIISMDYMYMESAESEDRGMPIIVAKDSESSWIMARVIPKKGKRVQVIRELGKMIDWMGHKRLALKSDQEPAILEVKECIKSERPEEVLKNQRHTTAAAMEMQRGPSNQCKGS